MIYRFAEFELDTNQSRLARAGKEIPLQPKVFEALLLLVRNQGQLVTKQQLMEALWPETFVNDEALAQIIFKLRRSLGDTRDEPRFVRTVLKRGFRFLPEVIIASTSVETPLPGDGEQLQTVSGSSRDSQAVTGPDVQDPQITPAQPVSSDDQIRAQADRRNAALTVDSTDDSREPLAGASLIQLGAGEARRNRRLALIYGLIALGLIATTVVVVLVVVREHPKPIPGAESRTLGDNRDTQKARRMTFFPERDEDADVAPDGKSFVFASKHGGDGLFKIYVMSTAEGSPQRLTRSTVEEQTPRFSPSAGWVAYTRTNESGSGHSVWQVPAMGGQESLLVADASLPDWSPDEREILFVRALVDGQYVLKAMLLGDKSEREILRWSGLIDMPAWSPDGALIAFVSNESAWVVPAEGGPPRRITESDVSVQTLGWTPDSKAIVCDATWGGLRNLWMRSIDGDDRPVPITSGPGVETYPSITRDWKVLYTSERWQRVIWSVDKAGKHPVNIPSKTTFESISIDPKGAWLAYSDYQSGDLRGNGLGLLNIKTLEQRKLGLGAMPVFSPDGRNLAFLKDSDDGQELHVMDLATGSSRRVSQRHCLKTEAAWSPDNTRIVFERADTGQHSGLAIVELATGSETALAEGNFES
ncbi:MAG TPA: winged helix-turn-helix domain-containing protein, partial [Blastocatellia bacterium]|nr:winged helix-turn-helix domain-containing protein [Blastocatellia bacterium]